MNTPGVCLERHGRADHWTLRQHRPRIGAALTGTDFDAALARVSLLLPLCQIAQSRAAAAAVTALGVPANGGRPGTARDLLREQGLSGAWRYLITWPTLLGEDVDPQTLRQLGDSADDATLARALRALLPDAQQVATVADLMDWAGAGRCVGARVLAGAFNGGDAMDRRSSPAMAQQSEPVNASAPAPELPLRMHRSEDLSQLVSAWLQAPEGAAPAPDATLATMGAPVPAGLEVAPGTGVADVSSASTDAAGSGPIYVGALAAARHPLVTELAAHGGLSLAAKCLAAQVLDSLAVADAIADDGNVTLAAVESRQLTAANGDRVGIGSAITTRGPLLHVVRQSERAVADAVASDWLILAPTDWHFAGAALLEHLLPENAGDTAAAQALAALDPCCASSVRTAAGAGKPDA